MRQRSWGTKDPLEGWIPRGKTYKPTAFGSGTSIEEPPYGTGIEQPPYGGHLENIGDRLPSPPRDPSTEYPPWPRTQPKLKDTKQFPTHIKTSPTREKSPAAMALKEKRPQRTMEEARAQYKSSIGDWWNAPNLPFLIEMRREQEGGDRNKWLPYITNEIEARAFMERVGISPEALFANRIIDLNTYYALRPDYKNRSW